MQSENELEQRVLQLVRSENYRPLKPRGIAKKLDLLDREREVKKTLKHLVKQGVVTWGPRHLVLKSDEKTRQNEVTGIFRRAAAGYGFVTPADSAATDRSEDVYIPKQKTADAADGDTVRIRTSRRRQGADIRISGRVMEVMARRTHRFVGIYRETDGYGFVTVDNDIFDSGILVGDAGAKRCHVGDVVVIEMARFPSPRNPGEGVIVEVLGRVVNPASIPRRSSANLICRGSFRNGCCRRLANRPKNLKALLLTIEWISRARP